MRPAVRDPKGGWSPRFCYRRDVSLSARSRGPLRGSQLSAAIKATRRRRRRLFCARSCSVSRGAPDAAGRRPSTRECSGMLAPTPSRPMVQRLEGGISSQARLGLAAILRSAPWFIEPARTGTYRETWAKRHNKKQSFGEVTVYWRRVALFTSKMSGVRISYHPPLFCEKVSIFRGLFLLVRRHLRFIEPGAVLHGHDAGPIHRIFHVLRQLKRHGGPPHGDGSHRLTRLAPAGRLQVRVTLIDPGQRMQT